MGEDGQFLEEDIVTHKAASSKLTLENAYHSIIDGLDSVISPDAIQESLKKCSPIDVDKEELKKVH
jgi:hypothetical protein